jgi:signal transduction histidine kinase
VPGELRQVFSNFLVNSLDAIGEDGTIKLRVSLATCVKGGQSCVRITVADNGTGMEAAVLAHIFEALFTTKESTGSGLGLWVSRRSSIPSASVLGRTARVEELYSRLFCR